MKQSTHSWIALRAIALLEDTGREKALVKLLKPHAAKAATGAWIPDQADAKRAGGKIGNHVMKILPYRGPQKERFTTDRKKLKKNLGTRRLITDFVTTHGRLDDAWWASPYKGDVPKAGQHLPNRTMGMSVMMLDLLVLGGQGIDELLPGDVNFMGYVHRHAQTQEEQAALYYLMQSHFIADACMPCHCDGRRLHGFGGGLHAQMERHWDKKVGKSFKKDALNPSDFSLSPDQILRRARDVDERFGLTFDTKAVPSLKSDVWLEMMYICIASFALAGIIAPPGQYPYNDPSVRAPFKTVLDCGNRALLRDVNRIVMHDAVLNVAMIWKHIWRHAAKGG